MKMKARCRGYYKSVSLQKYFMAMKSLPDNIVSGRAWSPYTRSLNKKADLEASELD